MFSPDCNSNHIFSPVYLFSTIIALLLSIGIDLIRCAQTESFAAK
jgi:hypothetical protein